MYVEARTTESKNLWRCMDIGIVEVRISGEKKTLGAESSIEGAELSIGGPRVTPKVYKLTPVALSSKVIFLGATRIRAVPPPPYIENV